MLEQIDLSKKMNEKEYNETVSHLEIRLAQLQRKCREQNIPVMIFMEGLEAAGKGTMINRLPGKCRTGHGKKRTNIKKYCRPMIQSSMIRTEPMHRGSLWSLWTDGLLCARS